jgi:hypothetical protein
LEDLIDLSQDLPLFSETELHLAPQNPSSPPLELPSIPQLEAGNNSMAFQCADPRPFTRHGFQALQVQHREMMVRAVAHRPQAAHEDYGIVTIHPLPDNALQFAAVREVVQEFLEENMNIMIWDIQHTH